MSEEMNCKSFEKIETLVIEKLIVQWMKMSFRAEFVEMENIKNLWKLRAQGPDVDVDK